MIYIFELEARGSLVALTKTTKSKKINKKLLFVTPQFHKAFVEAR